MTEQFETPAEVLADYQRIENECRLEDRFPAKSVYGLLKLTAERHPDRPASSFQLFSEPGSKAQTLSWREMLEKVTQAANLFRSLGVGEDDVVAYLLPGLNEAVITVTGAMTAGKANPINPLLEPEIIAAILRESGAKVLVTIKSFPKADLAEKAALAAALAPNVETISECLVNIMCKVVTQVFLSYVPDMGEEDLDVIRDIVVLIVELELVHE